MTYLMFPKGNIFSYFSVFSCGNHKYFYHLLPVGVIMFVVRLTTCLGAPFICLFYLSRKARAASCSSPPYNFSNMIIKESSPFHRPCRYHSNMSAPANILDHLPTLTLPCPGFVTLCKLNHVCMRTLAIKNV
jgi:hypothetical protein